MSYVRNTGYRNAPFSVETPHADFYIYDNVKDLLTKCDNDQKNVVRCRTVGVLQSEYTRFYLYDIDSTGVQTEYKIQLSVIYLKSSLPSTQIPYPVQVFGTLEWKNKPVLFVKLFQVLPVPTAIRIKDIMSLISQEHLAYKQSEEELEL